MDKSKNGHRRKFKMPGKEFRKAAFICFRKLFGCYYLTKSEDDLIYAYQKTKDKKSVEVQNVSKTYTSVDEIFSKLETVLNRSVQLQSQDLQFRDHLKESLLQITNLLEKIGSQYNLHNHCCNLHDQIDSSKVFPNFSNFKFQIRLSKGNLITCVNNPNSQSLDFIEENSYEPVSRNHSIVLHRCESKVFDFDDYLETKLDKNEQFFGKNSISLNTQSEKSVQSSTDYVPNITSFLKEGLLLRDVKQFSEISQLHLNAFKVNLVDHLKSVKKDVISLKNLLISIEELQNPENANSKNTEFGCIVNMDKYREEQKFLEAECRAKNFVRFWKMQNTRKIEFSPRNINRNVKKIDFCNLHN